MSLATLREQLQTLADADTARILQKFFKTGPGEYGEGDVFIGIKVPPLRKLAREFRTLALPDVSRLLKSNVHEERSLALMILVDRFERGNEPGREETYQFYLRHLPWVNNWDLVDSSAPYIVGAYLWQGDRGILYEWARHESLWIRRVAIIATFYFIRQNSFRDTLAISELLLNDKEDLIHKAVGWMLREVGKRDEAVLEAFLANHCKVMPRTMLRYAIEKFPEEKRRMYMRGAPSGA